MTAHTNNPRRARPTLYAQPMKQTAIWMPQEMIDWLKAQPGTTMSQAVRRLIDTAMKEQTK